MKRIEKKALSGAKPSVALSLVALLLMSSEVAAQDITPDSLSYEAYSSSTIELFWERSSIEGLSYEVRRNGQLQGNTNGTSYLDRTLSDGLTYTYDVVAIDPSGSRSGLSSISLSTGDSSEGQTVPQPSGLRAEVYSSRSIELFWDRSAESALTYEVLRNGSVIAATNGVSSYVRDLSPGTDYVFQVVAIDSDGNRSTPTTLNVATNSSSTSTGAETASALVATPSGLRSLMYSSRSAELFWDRPSTFGLSYEVLRDGAVLGSTDGVSFNDKTLGIASSYTYQVVAINAQGARSAAATIIINTIEGDSLASEPTPTTPTTSTTPVTPSAPTNNDNPIAAAIQEPAGFFDADGYDTVDVVRLDVRTVTTAGTCTEDDDSGCTLDDVKADIDGDDSFTVDIPIHFQGADLPDDGSINNAELRQRGGFTRLAPQKSFRVKLDSKEELWRGERRLQLNKMPYDQSRIKNKLSFDLMQGVPHLPSLRTQFVNLWIDDGSGPEDYGLFTHAEYVGKEYLVNREKDTDDNVYKIEEFVFSLEDLNYLAVDEAGEPVDEDSFETRLSIKSGDDHSKVIEMITAVNDVSRTFDSILDQYFDKDNVLAWVTVNFLLHQMDAVTHNFYLYNPVGTDKFYFMPWDYDGTFAVEQKPENSLDNSEMLRRLYYGFSKGRASNFLNRYYREPDIHAEIIARAAQLRNTSLSDAVISDLASRYSGVISEYASRMPDIAHNFAYEESYTNNFASLVSENHDALVNYGIPFPPKWRTPDFEDGLMRMRWREADNMSGASVDYDIEISTSPAFEAGDQLLKLTGLSEADGDGYFIDTDRIGSGERYARLIARSSANPDEFWQAASNRPVIDGEMRVGVIQFSVP